MRRGSLVQIVVLTLLISGGASAVAVFIPWLPASASRQAGGIDFLFRLATAVSILVFSLVVAVIVYSVVKFRARPDDDSDGPPIHGHTGLEIAWTIVPTLLVTTIAVASGVVLVRNDRPGRTRSTWR